VTFAVSGVGTSLEENACSNKEVTKITRGRHSLLRSSCNPKYFVVDNLSHNLGILLIRKSRPTVSQDMQDTTDRNNANLQAASRRQDQTSQACDACRMRKIRCQRNPPGDETSLLVAEMQDSISTRESTQFGIQRQPSLPCRRCSERGLKCSFFLPVGRRGPKGPRKK
jgi:hypothetical protein